MKRTVPAGAACGPGRRIARPPAAGDPASRALAPAAPAAGSIPERTKAQLAELGRQHKTAQALYDA